MTVLYHSRYGSSVWVDLQTPNMRCLHVVTLFSVICLALTAGKISNALKTVNEENWTDLLNGEWMVEFHAPWCPACKDLQKTWNSFADWSRDLNINVAQVDVTKNPGLSGRFLVTALPTIFHVKDGVFRPYVGSRDKNNFISFIEEKRWSLVDPIPSYKHPASPQMGVVAVFFRLSMSVRDLHSHLVENVGIPPWASYVGFAVVTLTLGCILGFFIVCIIDYVFPTGVIVKKLAEKEKKNQKKNQKSQNNKNSSEEKSSSVDSQESDESAELIGGDKSSTQKKSDKKGDTKKNK